MVLYVVAYLRLDYRGPSTDLGLEAHTESHLANRCYRDWESLDEHCRLAQFKVDGNSITAMRQNHDEFQRVAGAMVALMLLAMNQPNQSKELTDAGQETDTG